MHVDAVGDEFDGDARALQEGRDEPWLAVVERAFGVEQMRGDADARVDAAPRLVVRGVTVAEGGDRAVGHDGADGVVASGPFGREGHHDDGAVARVENTFDLVGVRVLQQAR